jgi:hypothetical protein
MILVLNELSYSITESETEASLWYDTLFDLCITIEKEFKIKLSIEYSESIKNTPFNHQLTFEKWLTQKDKNIKSSILSMLTKNQFIPEYPYYKIDGEEGKGIGFAYENDEVLISFITDDKWKVNSLSITQELLSENGDDIINNFFEIRNCFDLESKKFHNSFIHEKVLLVKDSIFLEIVDGKKLWQKKQELFPSIEFCENTSEYLNNLGGMALKNLLRRLKEYEAYFSQWVSGDFDITKIGGNPRLESESRINNFKNELMIQCPDGLNRLFSYHCNFGLDGFRLHFIPNYENRKCIIGYIGKKIV